MHTNHLLEGEVAPSVTMYRHLPPKVTFDEENQPVDSIGPGAIGLPVLLDWDVLEEMILDGKFQTKVEVTGWCRSVYTLLYDADDEATHWGSAAWRRIRDGLLPEALAALDALPQQVYKGRAASDSGAAQKLLKAGKCRNGHKIKSIEDLGSNGVGKNGRPRLGCIHCRRERSTRKRSKDKKGK